MPDQQGPLDWLTAILKCPPRYCGSPFPYGGSLLRPATHIGSSPLPTQRAQRRLRRLLISCAIPCALAAAGLLQHGSRLEPLRAAPPAPAAAMEMPPPVESPRLSRLPPVEPEPVPTRTTAAPATPIDEPAPPPPSPPTLVSSRQLPPPVTPPRVTPPVAELQLERLPAPTFSLPLAAPRSSPTPSPSPLNAPAVSPTLNAPALGQLPAAPSLNSWWDAAVNQPLLVPRSGHTLSLDDIITRAIEHSLQIKTASESVLVRQTMIEEACGQFDWAAFVESKWKDLNEPVGSTLVTGGPPRLLNDQYVSRGGFRKRTELGGQLEAFQQVGTETSNSIFFVPKQQGQSRMALSYRQPLLRNSGRNYNRALIVLAEIDTETAREKFLGELQGHLFDVTRAYWQLYLERATLLQKRRSLERSEEILRYLEKRQQLDVLETQLVQARAACEQRRASLIRAAAMVRNAESRLRLLVNDPGLPTGSDGELVPAETPFGISPGVEISAALAAAMHNRPEMGRALQEVKAGAVRLEMSQKELLPSLEMILESYVLGLDSSYSVSGAVGNQFSQGGPSYTAGLMFEMPAGNRVAEARRKRRQIELRQLQTQMQATLEQVKTDVELSVREVDTAWQEVHAESIVMRAAESKLNHLWQRWTRMAADEGAAGLVLSDLLSAQESLTDAEVSFVRAQVTYQISLVALQRATGTLLHDEGIVTTDGTSDCLPQVILTRTQKVVSPFMAPAPKPKP